MGSRIRRITLVLTTVLLIGAGFSHNAVAGTIGPPSHQLQHTIPGFEGQPINEAGTFFFPAAVLGQPFGSGPRVALEGVPLGLPAHGNADTTYESSGPTLPPGGTGTIDIEMVSLSLRSVDPVDIGGTLFNLGFSLSSAQPSLGTQDITSHDDLSNEIKVVTVLDVLIDITASEVGNSTNTIFAPGIADNLCGFCQAPWIGFSENASHVPSPGYPTPPGWPSGGYYWNNYIGYGDYVVFNGNIFQIANTPSIVPVPAALWLFAPAVTALALTRRKSA